MHPPALAAESEFFISLKQQQQQDFLEATSRAAEENARQAQAARVREASGGVREANGQKAASLRRELEELGRMRREMQEVRALALPSCPKPCPPTRGAGGSGRGVARCCFSMLVRRVILQCCCCVLFVAAACYCFMLQLRPLLTLPPPATATAAGARGGNTTAGRARPALDACEQQ